MADPNLISAVAQGLRPPEIVGTVARARAEVERLIATDQIADEETLRALYAANVIKSPNNIDIVI